MAARLVRDRAGEGRVALDTGDEALPADLAQHGPHGGPARRRGQLDALVGPRPAHAVELRAEGLGVIVERALEVGGVALGEGPGQDAPVAHERRAHADAGGQPLVGVDDPRIGFVDPREQRRERRRGVREQAVRAVHGDPAAVPPRDRGDLVDPVDRAGVGRARDGDRRDRDHAIARVGGHRGLQFVGPDPPVGVHRDLRDGAAAEAEHGRGAVDRACARTDP